MALCNNWGINYMGREIIDRKLTAKGNNFKGIINYMGNIIIPLLSYFSSIIYLPI